MDKSLDLKNKIIKKLDSNKALDIVSIDLEGKSSIADYMIIASGTSSRHIQSLSEQVYEELKINGITNCKIEAKSQLIAKVTFKVKAPGIKHGTLKISDYPNPNLTFDDTYYFSYFI